MLTQALGSSASPNELIVTLPGKIPKLESVTRVLIIEYGPRGRIRFIGLVAGDLPLSLKFAYPIAIAETTCWRPKHLAIRDRLRRLGVADIPMENRTGLTLPDF